jgi:hypothetical protein
MRAFVLASATLLTPAAALAPDRYRVNPLFGTHSKPAFKACLAGAADKADRALNKG